nr:glutathione S-transferase [Pseudomonadales bacterium]
MVDIRIFSYLPNPRVWKSLIAADLCGVEVEVVGDKPANLGNWLWDFDARELRESEKSEDNANARVSRRGFSGMLYKTDEFLKAHPYGTVPAAFSGDGQTGIFESNSILRSVVRASRVEHTLYGRDASQASRIDSFLDAGLVFAREAQVYLLGMKSMTSETYDRMTSAYEFYLNGIEQALSQQDFIASDDLSIADICFVCDLSQFLRERYMGQSLEPLGLLPIAAHITEEYPRAFQHMLSLGRRD